MPSLLLYALDDTLTCYTCTWHVSVLCSLYRGGAFHRTSKEQSVSPWQPVISPCYPGQYSSYITIATMYCAYPPPPHCRSSTQPFLPPCALHWRGGGCSLDCMSPQWTWPHCSLQEHQSTQHNQHHLDKSRYHSATSMSVSSTLPSLLCEDLMCTGVCVCVCVCVCVWCLPNKSRSHATSTCPPKHAECWNLFMVSTI